MNATLKFKIKCGEKTCAWEPGKFCEYCLTSPVGKDKCFLFGRIFDDNEGWLMRHPDCLERAEPAPPKPNKNKTLPKHQGLEPACDETAKPIEHVIEEIMADVPESELDKLPKDGASEHDHYLYGTPKKEKGDAS